MNTPKHDHKLLKLIPDDYCVSLSDLAGWTRVSRWAIRHAVNRYERKGLVQVTNRRNAPKPIRIRLTAKNLTTMHTPRTGG